MAPGDLPENGARALPSEPDPLGAFGKVTNPRGCSSFAWFCFLVVCPSAVAVTASRVSEPRLGSSLRADSYFKKGAGCPSSIFPGSHHDNTLPINQVLQPWKFQA